MKFTAYIWDHQLQQVPRDGLTVEQLAPYLNIRPLDASDYPSQIVVGEVEVDLDLLPPDIIIGNAAVALRNRAKEIRARAADEARKYDTMAEQLLAIENKPTLNKEPS